jgi:hypothetical protein
MPAHDIAGMQVAVTFAYPLLQATFLEQLPQCAQPLAAPGFESLQAGRRRCCEC